MTNNLAYNCPLLRARLLELYKGGMTWVRMQQKSDVNQTTISRYAQGSAGIQPETYRKLRDALGKELPVIGTPEHTTAVTAFHAKDATEGFKGMADAFNKVLGDMPAEPPAAELTCLIRLTGSDFTYDGFKLGFSFDGNYHEIDLPSGTNVEFGTAVDG